MYYKEIETKEQFLSLISSEKIFDKYAFQDIDFSDIIDSLNGIQFKNCIFLGCAIPDKLNDRIKESYIFPILDVPYNMYLSKLYSKDTLFSNYIYGKPESYNQTLDGIIYKHYLETGSTAKDIKETLARRLHDHSITDAMYDFLNQYPSKKTVAVMGGHALQRDDKNFKEVVKISKKLTELNYLMVSGGGPGAMEATHLGAWLAGNEDKSIDIAIDMIKNAPNFKHPAWLDTAFDVIEKFPNPKFNSLGIPTWLYGHEPPSPFATHIAKYFANSVREDGLLSIAKGGIIYTPGSAGTVQEVFQDATQNHYITEEYPSPMIFFDIDFWTNKMPIYTLLQKLQDEKKYKNLLLSIYDDKENIIEEILKFSEN